MTNSDGAVLSSIEKLNCEVERANKFSLYENLTYSYYEWLFSLMIYVGIHSIPDWLNVIFFIVHSLLFFIDGRELSDHIALVVIFAYYA